MLALDAAQIDPEPGLERRVDAVEIVLEQDVLGRNGGVGLQIEDPVAVRLLARRQGRLRAGDRVDQGLVGRDRAVEDEILAVLHGVQHVTAPAG